MTRRKLKRIAKLNAKQTTAEELAKLKVLAGQGHEKVGDGMQDNNGRGAVKGFLTASGGAAFEDDEIGLFGDNIRAPDVTLLDKESSAESASETEESVSDAEKQKEDPVSAKKAKKERGGEVPRRCRPKQRRQR